MRSDYLRQPLTWVLAGLIIALLTNALPGYFLTERVIRLREQWYAKLCKVSVEMESAERVDMFKKVLETRIKVLENDRKLIGYMNPFFLISLYPENASIEMIKSEVFP